MRTLEEVLANIPVSWSSVTAWDARALIREAHALGRSEGYAEGVEAAARFLETLTGPLNSPYQVGKQAAAKVRALRAPSPVTYRGRCPEGIPGCMCQADADPDPAPSPKEDAPPDDDSPRLCVDCRHYGKAPLGTPCEPCLNDWAEGRGASGWVSATNPAAEDAPRCEACRGTGVTLRDFANASVEEFCTDCRGTGRSTTGGGR